MLRLTVAIALFAACPLLNAQEESARRVLDKARALRPADSDLNLFRLDWADSVEAAMARAGRENRPVFCIANLAQYGDLKSGHC